MAAGMADIERWLANAKEEKATHLVVVCDTFDYDDYPVYVQKGQDVRKVVDAYQGKSMQQVMEVYNMSMPLEPQINERRSWNF